MTKQTILEDVVAYFESKTKPILERYGPGPRVHYHTGLVDDSPRKKAPIPELRRALVGGQELMLRHAADVWDASEESLDGEILDVGCGLGGGSIFWAEKFGAQVTAVTCVPSHAEYVARFAAEAGVEQQIETLVCDATEVPGENRFDAAVAVDSSGYLPRRDWLDRVASLLWPGGSLFIIDLLPRRPQIRGPFQQSLAYPNRHDQRIFYSCPRHRAQGGILRRRYGSHRALLDHDTRAHRGRVLQQPRAPAPAAMLHP